MLFALGNHGLNRALDGDKSRELLGLAARRVVREWHCSLSWGDLGPLKHATQGPATADALRSIRRVGFIMTVAARCEQFVSIAQPRRAETFSLECFRTLVRLGCVLTAVCHCGFGSPYLRDTAVLHNKPWLCPLERRCRCSQAHHWPGGGTFDKAGIAASASGCRPSLERVYGRAPAEGESYASFGHVLPLGLATRIAAGSAAAARGFVPALPVGLRHRAARHFDLELGLELLDSCSLEPPVEARNWHEDPAWISEICRSLQFRELFRYAFKKPGHINVNEARVYKTWVKSLARRCHNTRATALLDSRVTIGAAAKGRSSSFAISRILQGCLGYVLGSGLYSSLLHVYSGDNVADNPTRGKDVPKPTREEPRWLQDLRRGDCTAFEAVTAAARVPRNAARWLRFLLLLAGDIERNRGPNRVPPTPRGPLDLDAGFATSTAQKMSKSFSGFKAWIVEHICSSPESVFFELRGDRYGLAGLRSPLVSGGLAQVPFRLRHNSCSGRVPSASQFSYCCLADR